MFDRDLLEVFNDTVLHTPPKEVQLGACGREPLELDALRTTKRVEQLLAVTVQTRLVGHVDRKHLARWRGVRHVVILGIVGHEPLELAKGYTLAVTQNIV
jgi:hypothetical protein